MINTPFNNIHLALGAKMAPFAGYNMPISYSGIKDEHAAVWNSVGIFDVSHMGEFIVKGEGALDLLQRITSNDVSKLKKGDAQYSCFPNNVGGIVDDLLVYCIEENNVYIIFSPIQQLKQLKDLNKILYNLNVDQSCHYVFFNIKPTLSSNRDKG